MDYNTLVFIRERKKELAHFYKCGHYIKAVEGYMQLLAFPVDAAELANLNRDLAQSLFMLKDNESALMYVSKSLDIDPGNERSYIIGLRSAAALGNWKLFCSIIFSTFQNDICSLKIRDIVASVQAPKDVKAYIFSQLPKNHRRTWFPEKSDAPPPDKEPTECQENKPKNKKTQSLKDSFGANLSKAFGGSTGKVKKSLGENTTEMKSSKLSDPVRSRSVTRSADPHSMSVNKYENFKALCKNAAEAHQQKWQSLQLYQQAHSMARDLDPSQVDATQLLVIRFLIYEQQLETGDYVPIAEAIRGLKDIEMDNARILPAVYVSLAQGYTYLNRFKIGKEWVDKGQDFMRKGLRFKTMCYPLTNVTIAQTTREMIIAKLETLDKDCSVYHPRDAVCRYDNCEHINEHHIAPSRDIYFSDPDFDGCVILICLKNCRLQFHPACWKVYKGSLSASQKVTDKFVLGLTCITPDCKGTIEEFELIGADGQRKSHHSLDSDKQPAVAMRRSRQDMSQERRNSSRATAGAPSLRTSSVSIASSPTPPQKISSVLKCGCYFKPPDIPKPTPRTVSFENDVIDQPSKDPIKYTRDRKIQTDNPEYSDKVIQTDVDSLQHQIRDLTKNLESLQAANAKNLKSYEKLREKYITLKDREMEVEHRVIQTRDEERLKAVKVWKEAGEYMVKNWLVNAREKMQILCLMQRDSDPHTRASIERVLQQWRQAHNEVTAIYEDFKRETTMSAVAHVRLELPQLPSYPEDVYPVVKIMTVLLDFVSNFERKKSGGEKPQPQTTPIFTGSQNAIGPTLVQPIRYLMSPVGNTYYAGIPLMSINRPTSGAAPLHLPIPSHHMFTQNGFTAIENKAVGSPVTASLPQPFDVTTSDDNIPDTSSVASVQIDLVQKTEAENVPTVQTSENPDLEGGEWLPLSAMYETSKLTEIFPPVGPRANRPIIEPEQEKSSYTGREYNPSNPPNVRNGGSVPVTPVSAVSVTELPVKNSQQIMACSPGLEIPQNAALGVGNGILEPVPQLPVNDVPETVPPNKTEENVPQVKKHTRVIYGAPIRNRFEHLNGEIDLNPTTPGTSPDLSEVSNASSSPMIEFSAASSCESVPTASAILSEAVSTGPVFAMPHVPKKKKRYVSASPCSSVCSLDSLAALSDFGTSPARAAPPRPSSQLSSTVHCKLIKYLSTHFPAKSEEEIRRCLEGLRQENRQVYQRASLLEILNALSLKLGKRSYRRAILKKFTDRAWARPTGVPASVPGTRVRQEVGECSICFDPLGGGEATVMTLKCSHVFHSECLQQWLVSDHTCPLCRDYVITQEDFPELI